jgi:hypothetical protein
MVVALHAERVLSREQAIVHLARNDRTKTKKAAHFSILSVFGEPVQHATGVQ